MNKRNISKKKEEKISEIQKSDYKYNGNKTEISNGVSEEVHAVDYTWNKYFVKQIVNTSGS